MSDDADAVIEAMKAAVRQVGKAHGEAAIIRLDDEIVHVVLRAGEAMGWKMVRTKKLLYFSPHNPCCCDDGKYRSQEQLIGDRAIAGVAYLVDEITGKEWGDDWNDAPSCCNSGAPYENTCVGLTVVEIRFGDAMFAAAPALGGDDATARAQAGEEP